jgi:signal transduction histidine kinase
MAWITGVRARMVGPVLVAIVPLVVIYLVQTADLRDQAELDATADGLRLSRMAANSVASELDETRSLLTTATRGLVTPSTSSCTVPVDDIRALQSGTIDALVIDGAGTVICSSVPASIGLDLGDRAPVVAAAAQGGFAAGPEFAGDLSPTPALLAVLPVEGIAPVAQVATLIDPTGTIATFVAEVGLSADAAVSLVDSEGRVLSSTSADDPAGEVVPMEPLVDQLATGAVEGTATAEGADGVERIYGYADVDATNQSVYAIVGLPTEAAFAPIARELRIDILALTLVGSLAILLALVLSEASVVRPVGDVIETVRRIGGGDLGARTTRRAARGEIGDLARSIDDMAEGLQVRERSLRVAAAERERLLDELLSAEEEERRRIASDIHDDTIQMMAAAGLEVGTLRRALAVADADQSLRDKAETVERSVYDAVRRLRHLMFELEPPRSDDGLQAGIERYLAAVLSSTPVVVEVDVDGATEPAGVTREVMYRNIREAAINATRHGDARRVTVSVRSEDDGLGVRVVDDGHGFDATRPPPAGHLGVVTMRRRTESLAGTFSIESAPGDGTMVSFWLPAE